MALRALFPSFAFDACERGGGGGLKPEFHLMAVNPQTSNQSPLPWDATLLARHIIESENKWSKYLAVIEAFVKSVGSLSPDVCCVFLLLWWRSFIEQKLNSLGTCLIDVGIYWPGGSAYLGGQAPAHSTIKLGPLLGNRHNGGHSDSQIQGDLMVCPCLCPCNNVRGLTPGEPTGGNAAWWWGGGCGAYRGREEQLLGA